MNSKTLDFYIPSINYILEVQNSDGSIPWEKGKKLDPWDHVEACMGLSIAGKKDEAEQAFCGFLIINLKMALGILNI